MIRPLQRLQRATLRLSVALVLTFAACAPTNLSPTASQLASPSPGPSAAPSATAPTAPTSSGLAGASPAMSATAPPSASALACPVVLQTGLLPSDRLVDLAISSPPTGDLLTFVFAAPTTPTPAGPPRGSLDAAQPPFSYAGSGQPFALLGEHAVQLRFTGMTIASEAGDPTFKGPGDATPELAALREAILYDASEGVIGWYIGYDGPGCVTLSRNANAVTVTIGRPEAQAG